MADQVNSISGSSSGAALTLIASAAPRLSSEKPSPAKNADPKIKMDGVQSVPDGTQTPLAAMGKLNGYLEKAGSELQFQMDESTGRTVFKVVNPSSGQVVFQVPSEEVLAMARNLRNAEKSQNASGVLLNKEG